ARTRLFRPLPPSTCGNVDRHVDHLQWKPDHGHHLLHLSHRHGAPASYLPRCSPDQRRQEIALQERALGGFLKPHNAGINRDSCAVATVFILLLLLLLGPIMRQRSDSRCHASADSSTPSSSTLASTSSTSTSHTANTIAITMSSYHHDIYQRRLGGFDEPVRTCTEDKSRSTKSWTVLPRRRRRRQQSVYLFRMAHHSSMRPLYPYTVFSSGPLAICSGIKATSPLLHPGPSIRAHGPDRWEDKSGMGGCCQCSPSWGFFL
ncbi:hypothetical protein CSHISOI_04641, partial [Colletotrichum shisoi]